jgi:biotin-dependent carboxylase-like uncharacterized protein
VNWRGLEVLTPGPLSTVQDLGRPGVAELGIGCSGAADRASFTLANQIVGNSSSAAGIEITFGGLAVEARGEVLVAVTGAPCPLRTTPDTGGVLNTPFPLRHRQRLTVGRPRTGVRTYLAVRGGLDVEAVLGSRSTDLLAGIGPARLTAGSYLGVADDTAADPVADRAAADPVLAVTAPPAGVVGLSVVPGPRDDWFTLDAVRLLTAVPYEVSSESNRIGMRLQGPELVRARRSELPSEGLVPGSLQVPPDGRPTLLLADHPVTGGYPVIAVVIRADVDRAAQARPGQLLRFFLLREPIRP